MIHCNVEFIDMLNVQFLLQALLVQRKLYRLKSNDLQRGLNSAPIGRRMRSGREIVRLFYAIYAILKHLHPLIQNSCFQVDPRIIINPDQFRRINEQLLVCTND